MKTVLFTRLLTVAFALTCAMPTDAAPGDLDTLDPGIVGSSVCATAEQADGKTLIVGSFTNVWGVPRNHIARLNADGSLDEEFDPKAGNSINSVVVQPDGKILIGGNFTTLQPNGAATTTQRIFLARLHPDGTLDPAFTTRTNATVSSIHLQPDGKILVCGSFTSVRPTGAASDTPRNRIARFNADGTLDTGFDPNANAAVRCLALQTDGKVLLGGEFTSLQPNNVPAPIQRNYIARLDGNGSLDPDFDPNPNAQVRSLVIQSDGLVLMGGSFTSLQPSGTPSAIIRNRIARLGVEGTVDGGFDPNASGTINSLALQTDGGILLGGTFTSLRPNGAASSTPRNRIVRVNANGTLDTGFNPDSNNIVHSVAVQADGRILIGGTFSALQPNGASQATARNYFARLVNDPANQTLSVPDASRVTWMRGGSAPELLQASFEQSNSAGDTWVPLGNGNRIMGGWELGGLSLPASGIIRARGRVMGGQYSASSGMIEQVESFTISNNKPPSELTLTNQSILENQASGTLVGNFSSVDPDENDTHLFTFAEGEGDDDNASFRIVGNALQANGDFDYESKSSYTIRVRTTDTGGLFLENVFVVSIIDVNEAPTDIALTANSIAENQAPGTAVGTFSASDPDDNDTHSFTFAEGEGDDDNATFNIVGNALQTNGNFDYESKSSYTIRMRATDTGGLFLEKVFVVSILDVNEAPTDIALSNSSVAENQPLGTVVGTFSVIDPDAGDTHTVSLAGGAGGDDNASFSIDGNALLTNEVFDFETKSSYSIRVRTSDIGGLSFEKQFIIEVQKSQTLGPDAFGYIATDGIAYDFEDISGSENANIILPDSLDAFASAPINFDLGFEFYGETYHTVYISNKGLISLLSGNTEYTNTDLSSTTFGRPVIAALWDDWVTNRDEADKVFYETRGTAGERRFIVQWEVNPWVSVGVTSPVSFQTILYEATGEIRFNYRDVTTITGRSDGASATIGIQDTGGNATGRRLQWSFNTASVTNGTSILYTPGGLVNTFPEIGGIDPQRIQINSSTGDLPFTIGDAETPAGNLTVSAASSNTALVPNANVAFGVFGESGSDRTVSVTPAAGLFGSVIITVTVSDGVLSTSTQFTVIVEPPMRSIGPDVYGYTATNVIGYEFLDVSGADPMVPQGTVILDDMSGSAQEVDIGFGFPFYGNEYSKVYISTRGLISFGSGNTNGTNADLLSTDFGQPVIAALWDLWATNSTMADKVYFKTVGEGNTRIFIVQWDVNPSGSVSPVSFQALLDEDTGQIRFNYRDVTTITGRSDGASATIGIQDTGGNTSGRRLQWSFNTTSVVDGTSILFTPGELVNTFPTIGGIAPQRIQINSSTDDLPFIVGDAETPAGNLTVSTASSNTALVSNANVVFGGSGADRTVSVTPAAGLFGSVIITVTVSDAELSSSTQFTVIVEPPLRSIGPDVYGYTATNAIGYEFLDISGADPEIPQGTVILTNHDDEFESVPIGFGFEFYGQHYSTAFISTEGLISFMSGSTAFSNQNFTSTNFGQPVIAALWDDWATNRTEADQIYYRTLGNVGQRMFIVQWEVNPFGNTSPVSFQSVLYEATGEIGFNYRDVTTITSRTNGVSSTIGIQNTGGNTSELFLQWSFNTVSIVDETSILFTWPVNQPPTISPIADMQTTIGVPLHPIPFTVADVETPAEDLVVTAESNNTTLVPTENISILFGDTEFDRTVTVIPEPGQTGIAIITLTVSDGEKSASAQFQITVSRATRKIGPDAYGYTATDAINHEFIDISQTGTTILTNHDDAFLPVPIGFNFSYYGNLYSTAYISTNGIVSFISGSSALTNQNFSSANFGQPVIAALWDDWATNLSGTDQIYYRALGDVGQRVFIVQWDVNPYQNLSPVSFQLVLYEATGQIRFNYADVTTISSRDNGVSSTIGIQNTGGNSTGNFLQWSFNTASVVDHLSILISPMSGFEAWAFGSGLSGADAGLTANPANDGVVNLLKYAFNLDPRVPDTATITPGMISAAETVLHGLPLSEMVSGRLRIYFLKPVEPGITVAPLFTDALSIPREEWTPQPASVFVREHAESGYQLHYADDPAEVPGPRRFGTVRVHQIETP